MALMTSITLLISDSVASSVAPASGQAATIKKPSRSGKCRHIASVTNGINGCSNVRTVSRTERSVCRTAFLSPVPSRKLIFASSRYQSQNSFQVKSCIARPASPNW